MNDAVMTLEEVALFLKVSETTIYQLTRSGELPARKVGREWRYLKTSLIAWLQKGGESMEGTVMRDEFGGEFKIENGQEMVALWLPLGLEEKHALVAKAAKEDWSLSEKVMQLVRELQK
jgi:excisionase family DNA binding protein